MGHQCFCNNGYSRNKENIRGFESKMLETKDLILHEGSADDWQDLYKKLWSRPEVFTYMFSKPCADEQTAKKKTEAYAEMHKEVKTEFFVYDKSTTQAIGIAGIKEMSHGLFTVTDIAISPDFQGKGYGKQIVNALVNLAFIQYNASEVLYDCFAENTASKALALACGFVYSHSAEAELKKNGKTVVLDYYHINKSTMKIGLAAYRFINNDTDFNVSQIEKAMQISQGKANLLCFGETFLQGFDAFNWNWENDKNIAITQNDSVIKDLCELTCKYGVDLQFGYLEKDGEKLYSSCMLISEGQIIHNYRRISKGWKEYSITDGHYCEGESSSDFIYKGKTFRITLCGDLWDFPEKFKTTGILLWPVYVNFSLDEWSKYESEYADQAYLAADKTLLINSISDEPEAIGGAFVFEKGKITARIPYNSERILYVEV